MFQRFLHSAGTLAKNLEEIAELASEVSMQRSGFVFRIPDCSEKVRIGE